MTPHSFASEHQAVLMSNPWFAQLPERIRLDVIGRGRIRLLPDGQRLFARGNAPDGVYCILSGAVRLCSMNREGRETLLDICAPGSWIGDVSTLDAMPRTHDAVAHRASVLLHIASADFESLLGMHSALCRAFLRFQSQRTRTLMTAVESYASQSLDQRLARRLLDLARHHGHATDHGVRIDLHLPQDVLARLIGATRQRVNQILRLWESKGVVEQQYGRILLIECNRLEQLAQI